jgi:hypothetical protein
VTEDQPLLSGPCPAVFADNDLAIRTADAERDAVDEQLSWPCSGSSTSTTAADPSCRGTTVSARIAGDSLTN